MAAFARPFLEARFFWVRRICAASLTRVSTSPASGPGPWPGPRRRGNLELQLKEYGCPACSCDITPHGAEEGPSRDGMTVSAALRSSTAQSRVCADCGSRVGGEEKGTLETRPAESAPSGSESGGMGAALWSGPGAPGPCLATGPRLVRSGGRPSGRWWTSPCRPPLRRRSCGPACRSRARP